MRIGLLTYHWVPNYGANLQTYSTYKFLENNGMDPIIINWIPEETLSYYQKMVKREQLSFHKRFIESQCRLTRLFSEPTEILDLVKEYNISGVIIGSDSLFNIQKSVFKKDSGQYVPPRPDHDFPNPFWGHGFIDIPHVALSVSCQNAHYFDFCNEKNSIKEYLNHFSSLTVRDDWTKEMVEYFTDAKISPVVTPDPVFSFNSNVKLIPTKEEIINKYNLSEDYVLFAFKSSKRYRAPLFWQKRVKKLFHKFSYQCVSLPLSVGSQDLEMDKTINMPIDPLDWYCIIKYSRGYVGLLMHPIVICLHNSIPFYSFDHYGDGPMFRARKQSSKIYHILKSADLLSNHRLIKNKPWMPLPSTLVDRILNFPLDKCRAFSEKQNKDCINNFTHLLNSLKDAAENEL